MNIDLTTPRVTKILLMMNIIMYFMIPLIPIEPFKNMLSYGLFSGEFNPIQLLTSMFLHANFMHLFMNMIILWMVGRTLENEIGSKKFILIYIISGIGGSLIQGIFFPYNPSLGASSAIFGILMSLVIIFPNKEIKLFLIPFLKFKIKYLIGFIFLLEVVDAVTMVNDNIGHWAHVGGGIVGMMMSGYFTGKFNKLKYLRNEEKN